MNGATLLSATVVVNSSATKTINNETFNYTKDESNDENDESESESEDEDFIEIEDNKNNEISNSNESNNSSEQKTSNDTNSLERTSTTIARLRTNRKSKCNSSSSNRDNKLDPVRFSMYAIQNSQLNEIDALLSELNQLQTTLDYSEINNKNSHFVDSSNEMPLIQPLSSSSSNYLSSINNHTDEIEAIDQQFDEVLKFLAQSINEQTNLSSPASSSASSPSSVSLGQNNVKKDRSSGSSSSNSSGIGDDFESPSSSKSKSPKETCKQDQLKSSPTQLQQQQTKKRNSSDSAFLETISMPSSHSLATIESNKSMIKQMVKQPNFINVSSSSSNMDSNSSEPSPVSDKSKDSNEVVLLEKSLSPTQLAEAQKAEMIRIALEKLKEANIKKLIVKAYTDDGCTKSVIIDETMKCYDVMLLLFSKNHTKPTVKYSIVEYLPKFHMERIFEDHENIVEAMSNWTRDSENQIIFTEKETKYDLFLRPELYLLTEPNTKIDDNHRNKLLNEFFQNIGSPVPEIEGPLYIKVESKKSWKKYYCVLRQSGLYYIPKGKNKKDLQCLFNFDKLDLYYGIDWRKKYKAPTNSCFALKYPQVQKKSSKYIKYICCENDQDMKRWFNGIRIAKFGKQLYDNYKKILELIEMNKVSGRLPMASTRRLSASINNKNQRPRSSYSLVNGSSTEISENLNNNNSNTNTTVNVNNSNESSSVRGSFANLESNSMSKIHLTNAENNTSLLMRQQSVENKNNSSTKDLAQKEPVNKSVQKQDESSQFKQVNLSYTDQLKSLLEAHQSMNQLNQQQKQIFKHSSEQPSTNYLNNNFNNNASNNNINLVNNNNKPWTSPISISTSNINSMNQIQFSPTNITNNNCVNSNNSKGKIPLTNEVTKQMLMLNSTPLSSATSSSLSPASQQLYLSSPNLTDSIHRPERPEPPKQLELDVNTPMRAKSIQMISPTNKTEIKIDINGFKMSQPEIESVYDLPTPPMEIFAPPPPPPMNDYEHIQLPSPPIVQPSTPTVQSQIIVQLSDNRNSTSSNTASNTKSSPVQPPIAPKPVFKRLNSFNNSTENDIGSIKMNGFNNNKTPESPTHVQVKERKSFGFTNSNHLRGSSLTRTSSLLQQQQQQQMSTDAGSELTAILARQKKKIEEQTGDFDSSSSKTKIPSPNVVKKPPPPPRVDKTLFFRKMSNEY